MILYCFKSEYSHPINCKEDPKCLPFFLSFPSIQLSLSSFPAFQLSRSLVKMFNHSCMPNSKFNCFETVWIVRSFVGSIFWLVFYCFCCRFCLINCVELFFY